MVTQCSLTCYHIHHFPSLFLTEDEAIPHKYFHYLSREALRLTDGQTNECTAGRLHSHGLRNAALCCTSMFLITVRSNNGGGEEGSGGSVEKVRQIEENEKIGGNIP